MDDTRDTRRLRLDWTAIISCAGKQSHNDRRGALVVGGVSVTQSLAQIRSR